MRRSPYLFLLLGPIFPSTASAAVAEGSAAGSVLSMLFGLAVVLAVLFGLMHVLRRVQQHGGHSAPVRVVGGASVGPRERVVLVEVADKVLVLGVAPGQISTLHTLDAEELPRVAPPAAGLPAADFASKLVAAMKGRRNAG